jgi:hypothetical protein
MSASSDDDEYDPSSTKVVQKPVAPVVSHSNNNNIQTTKLPNQEKRVFGVREATSIVSIASSSSASSMLQNNLPSTSLQNSNNALPLQQHQQQQLPLINYFLKNKNILPIYGEDEYSSASASSKGFCYRVQRPGGAIRCVAASGSILLAGTSTGTNSNSATRKFSSSSTSSSSCPLFAWDIREIARGSAVGSGLNLASSSTSTAALALSSSNKISEGSDFKQHGRFLFKADLFERDRNGIKQHFPAAFLTFISNSSSSSNSTTLDCFNTISFNGTGSSNVFAAAAAGSSNFKIAKIDNGGIPFAESPSGTAGSLNPETFRGHCGNILSLRSYFDISSNSNASSSSGGKPAIVSAGADGTVRLWSLENVGEKNVYCARHGGLSAEGLNFSRSSRVIGGGMSNNSNNNNNNLIWSAGLDDGFVMFWDTRQKFKLGLPQMYLRPPHSSSSSSSTNNNSSEVRIANCLEIPSNSGTASLFAVRSLNSLRIYDLRKVGGSAAGGTSSSSSTTTILPEITDLRLASPADAAPMILANDVEAGSKNIVTTWDSANEAEDYFRDGVAVVSLTSGKIVHKASMFSLQQQQQQVQDPPLIHGIFGISGTGHVGLACSDGLLRFAPTSALAIEKHKKALLSNGGVNVMTNPWFENVPMMTSTNNNNHSKNISGNRRNRNDVDDDDHDDDADG